MSLTHQYAPADFHEDDPLDCGVNTLLLSTWMSERGPQVFIGAWDEWNGDAGWSLNVEPERFEDGHAHSVWEDWRSGGWYAQYARGGPAALTGTPTLGQALAMLAAMDAGQPLPRDLLADPDDPAASPPPPRSRRRREFSLTDEQKKAIVDAYAAGLSAESTAREFGVVHQTVINLARKASVPVRSNREMKVAPADRAAIARAYQQGETTVSLAQRYGIAQSTATEIIREAGVQIRTRGKRLEAGQQDEIAQAYATGTPSPALAAKYGVSKQTVLSIVRKRGGKVRHSPKKRAHAQGSR